MYRFSGLRKFFGHEIPDGLIEGLRNRLCLAIERMKVGIIFNV